jgi:hypothetical protein
VCTVQCASRYHTKCTKTCVFILPCNTCSNNGKHWLYFRVDQLQEGTDPCIFAFACAKFIFLLEYSKLLQQSRFVLSLVLTVGFLVYAVYAFHNLFPNFHICAVNYKENINGRCLVERGCFVPKQFCLKSF